MPKCSTGAQRSFRSPPHPIAQPSKPLQPHAPHSPSRRRPNRPQTCPITHPLTHSPTHLLRYALEILDEAHGHGEHVAGLNLHAAMPDDRRNTYSTNLVRV